MLLYWYMESPNKPSPENEKSIPPMELHTEAETVSTEGHTIETPKDLEIVKQDTAKMSSVREKLGLLTKSVRTWWESTEHGPKTNILYRSDRMYRCIGESGYNDFIATGTVGSKNSAKYADVSFNIGAPASLYMQGDSGNYILEATADSANFELKVNPYSLSGKTMDNIPYRSIQPGELTKASKLRIFKKVTANQNGTTYEVVFDNIGDQALKDQAEEKGK